jgi:hypothetical protein
MENIDICDSCKFNKKYISGIDEYPPYTKLSYCSKGHWHTDDNREETVNYFKNCKDYENSIN